MLTRLLHPPLIVLVLISALYPTALAFTNIDLTHENSSSNILSIIRTPSIQTNFAMKAIGDINDDGMDDAALSDPLASTLGRQGAGKVHVVFGSKNKLSDIDMDTLVAQGRGFVISGVAAFDWLGFRIAGIGDINNDGINDMIVSSLKGSAYVIFGRRDGITDIDLANLTQEQGFKLYISLPAPEDICLLQVERAGDFNSDGVDDLIIGYPYPFSSPLGRNEAGTAYIIFGHTGVFSDINLNTITSGAHVLKIIGKQPGDQLGNSVSSAGDFNADGIDDVIIATGQLWTYGDRAFVIYGHEGPFTDLDLANLQHTQGFKIASDNSGAVENGAWTVANAGDFNQDGINDVCVGLGANRTGSSLGLAYVIYGRSGGFSDCDMADLDSTQKFTVMGNPSYFRGTIFGSQGRDLNNDGIDDIVFGVPYTPYFMAIFGRKDGVSEANLDNLGAADGIKITVSRVSWEGFGDSLDFDGDGKTDLLVARESGAYVIFGEDTISVETSQTNVTAIVVGTVVPVILLLIITLIYVIRKRKGIRGQKSNVNMQNQNLQKLPSATLSEGEPVLENIPMILERQNNCVPNVEAISVVVSEGQKIDSARKERGKEQNQTKLGQV